MRNNILERFIGLTFEQAQELAWEESYQLRVTHRDGVPYICIRDVRYDRINVMIVEDLIAKADFG